MRRTYMYRLYPTNAHAREMQRQCDVGRELYNACLEERRACYKATGKGLTYYDQANQLKAIRRECPDIATVNFSMLQAVCRRAQRGFESFFRRLKAGQKPGYPRFKSGDRWDSITFPSYGDGCKLTGTRLYLQGIGQIKVKLHRPVAGTIKTVTLRRKAGKWYTCLSCEVEVAPLAATGRSVGIDMGLTHFLTTDTGAMVENPRPMGQAHKRLRVAQRALARCKRGSARRAKVKRRVTALHEKVANTRKDFHHKTAHALVQANDTICHEDLHVANMVQNHSLARAIHDVAWSRFITILASKAEEAGRTIIAVDPRNTSQTCLCGARVPKTLADRWHECPECGLSLPRDQVSAMLIKREGHSRQATTTPLGVVA